MNFDSCYVGLAVDCIKRAKMFYERIGFHHLEDQGGIEDQWLILQNGDTRLGLYQDMFPQNLIVLRTPNLESVYQKLKKEGVEIELEVGMQNNSGPSYFAVVDPDGNVVLFDT